MLRTETDTVKVVPIYHRIARPRPNEDFTVRVQACDDEVHVTFYLECSILIVNGICYFKI